MLNDVLFGNRASSILPDDQEIASRYVTWKHLLDKYNQPGTHDEEGILVDDVLELFNNFADDRKYDDENAIPEEEALECSDESEDVGSSYSASEYETMKKQYTSALKERNVQWKANGLECILNSDFSMSADSVLQWIQSPEAGIGKLLTNTKETRFSEYNDNTQMNVTRREDISILNESDRRQFTAANTSNIEYMDKHRGRMIKLHQVEKRTVSSYFVIEPMHSDVARPNLDMEALLQSLPDLTALKQSYPLASYNPAKKCPSVTMVPESCLKSVLNKQVKPASQRKQKNVRKEYPMPESYRQVYSINGRCRYKTSGIVIYRPKPIGHTLPMSTDKICIRTEDLDLTGIESMEKRQKFAKFCRLAHPNSTLVYYMSESDDDDEVDETEDDSKDISWDDDDPILTYNPPCVLTFFDD
uniref:Uncharacterized protein n=1 Tax=Anopheles farauti TaxID=69004 RepID=A0A182PZQ4_9DIPT